MTNNPYAAPPDDVVDLVEVDKEQLDHLYAHRNTLFVALAKAKPKCAWRARVDHTGQYDPDWFVAGMHLPTGDISYHLPADMWDQLDFVAITWTGKNCPPFDGHTSTDVLERLKEWNP